jgi:outer membrane protein assembly factor BamA
MIPLAAGLVGASLAALTAAGLSPIFPLPAASGQAEPARDDRPPAEAAPTIGGITIDVVEVFDARQPSENRLFHRAVNTLHIRTQPRIVLRELLFREGDTLDPDLLAETERNLRALPFLRDAEVTSTIRPDGLADVHVVVKDSWTTRAGYSLGRSGGNTSGSLSARERNLLGLGKELAFKFSTDQDRSTDSFAYLDPRLFGTRLRLFFERRSSSDGDGEAFSFHRPFYSLDSRWTAGVRGSRNLEARPVYSDGEEIAEFDNETESGRIFYGFSRGLKDHVVKRYTFAWTYNSTRNRPREELPDDFPPEEVPIDRTVSAPQFSYRRERSEWIEERNVIRMARPEDFNLGTVLEIETAVNTEALGGTDDELLLDALVAWGMRTSRHGLLFFKTDLDGRYGAGSAGQSLVSFETTYYDGRLPRQTLVAHLKLDVGVSLDSSDRLLLGGDEGLRGFESRILEGDRRLILNLEDRFWTGREILHLAHLGAAAFVDVGNAWGGPNSSGFGLLHSNVGVGLRFDASRASQGGLLRFDFAFPVSGDRRDGPAIQVSFGRGLGY